MRPCTAIKVDQGKFIWLPKSSCNVGLVLHAILLTTLNTRARMNLPLVKSDTDCILVRLQKDPFFCEKKNEIKWNNMLSKVVWKE